MMLGIYVFFLFHLGGHPIYHIKVFPLFKNMDIVTPPPMPRGNWRRSCLMARNEDDDPDHDDYEHVHIYQPGSPPHISSST
jgi:hypothetical protein